MPKNLAILRLSLILLLVGACDTYDFTVNDKIVYTPKPLFSDFKLADDALQQCLEQAVIDNNITVASDLVTLNCSHAGVTDLTGLETFSAITQLGLSSNEIQDITPLAALSVLEVLLLNNNQIIQATPLLELPALSRLNLNGNEKLSCPSGTSLMNLEVLTLPGHCS